MYLIAGLGNPGKKYEGSRHNLGFRVIEALSRRLQAGKPTHKHRAICVVTEYKTEQVMLAQPLTFMNRSGIAVNELVRNYHVELNSLLVIFDDLDLPPGEIRLKKKGGSAGHRGIQSVIDVLGTSEFPRLRIGVGKPPPYTDGAEYVLRPIEPADDELINEAVERAVEAALLFISEGLETAMNYYNQGLSSAD